MRLFSAVVIALLLSAVMGCQSSSKQPVSPTRVPVSHPDFAGYRQVAIEPEAEVFALGPEALGYVKAKLLSITDPKRRIRVLVRDLFERTDESMLYSHRANTVANDTFLLQQANCLSLSILTYALAEAAQLDASFNQVDIPEYWTRRNGVSLLNGHVNIKIFPPYNEQNFIVFIRSGVLVDFFRLGNYQDFPSRMINKSTVLGMFYNNKGSDALLAGDYPRAFAYFSAAVRVAPDFESSWVNLGYLYRRVGAFAEAEATYKHALSLNPDNLTGWENLGVLYAITGRKEQSDQIKRRIQMKRQANPFYHFMLAEEARDNGQPLAAIKHLKRAIRLDSKQHEFYFGLARLYFDMGDQDRAREYLQRAKSNASTVADEIRYMNKLALLNP